MGHVLPILFLAAALGGWRADAAATDSGTNAPVSFDVQPGLRENPVDRAYQALLAADDAAQEEVDRWIREADSGDKEVEEKALQKRIDDRLRGIEEAYRKFLNDHASHVEARVAFGSFLADTGRELEARTEWEKALVLAPRNPAIYNNLAGTYGHRGPVTNAFVCYEKAIELAPDEPVYYQNFATTVFLFRRDVMAHYGFTDEQKVFDKALALYSKAQELDPGNFILATDIAQTYYGIRPPRHDAALAAWRRALALASDDLERQGVLLHVARVEVQAGRFDAARIHLNLVTNAAFAHVKGLVQKTLERKSTASAPPVAPTSP